MVFGNDLGQAGFELILLGLGTSDLTLVLAICGQVGVVVYQGLQRLFILLQIAEPFLYCRSQTRVISLGSNVLHFCAQISYTLLELPQLAFDLVS